MKVMGFNFNKVSIEKISDKVENLEVKTNIDISEIKEVKSEAPGMKGDFIGAKFNFDILYEPNFAKINILGTVLFAVKPEIAKDILEKWKDKKMPEDFRFLLFNIILRKASLKALQLEEDMNLPLHVAMPSLKKQESQEENK